MTFSTARLPRLRALLERHVEAGFVPGAVVVLARNGEVHTETVGTLAFAGDGAQTPMATDTIFRLASMSKPIVAAAVLTLVEDCTLRLDDPVDDLLPELAGMRVLADPSGPLDDTVEMQRPITVRDVLTFTLGTGMVPDSPIGEALWAVGEPAMDEWLGRLGALPLVHQPGERWLYDTAADVSGALIARATGKSFGEALRERVFEPLGMKDSGFSVGGADLWRFATAYDKDEDRAVADPPDGQFSRPPVFESGSGGLVSTADDFLAFAFASALLAGGGPMLSRAAVSLMTTDQLTAEQKAIAEASAPGWHDGMGWGFGMSIRTGRRRLGPSIGSYGWPGFWGTAWYNDPAENLTSIVLLQRGHMGDQRLPLWNDFWTTIYQALD